MMDGDCEPQPGQAIIGDAPRAALERAPAVGSHGVGARVALVRPSHTLPISLTGTDCALKCAHCGGQYLKGMVPIDQAGADGYTSCLISGGCDLQGRVPLGASLDRLAELHSGRLFNWHVGLASEREIRPILPYLDVVSFDIVGDDRTIREVYGLDATVADYKRTYAMLRRHGRVVPHLTLGLYGGEWRGEDRALEWLADQGAEALVLLVMVPTPGTRYADCCPPSVNSVVDFIERAGVVLGDVPVYLGCMRPGGRYRQELDPLAIAAGVVKIVNPARAAVEMALAQRLSVSWENECCVIRRP